MATLVPAPDRAVAPRRHSGLRLEARQVAFRQTGPLVLSRGPAPVGHTPHGVLEAPCMPPEVSLAQHLRDRESSLPPKGFHNPCFKYYPRAGN